MLIRTVVRGRRVIYQLRHSQSRKLISAASTDYLDIIRNQPFLLQRIDPNLRILCEHRTKKSEAS